MNNTCPTCGAVYNVAGKDIGRRIKCKKCSSALVVSETGLEVDAAEAVPFPAPAPAVDDAYQEDLPRPKSRRRSSSSIDPIQMFSDFGGVPTLLFAFGAFLVIVFLFSPLISEAAVSRAKGAEMRAQMELDQKIEKARKIDKKTDEDINKMREEYNEKKAPVLKDDINYARISALRDIYFDRYGMMLGFLFLMVGSLGFMGPGQSQIRRIVGSIVLCAQVIIIFMVFAQMSGCGKGAIPGT